MHEYSLSIEIMEIIIKEAINNFAKIINSATIKLDPFVNANPIQLEFCLRYIAKNTIAENAIFIFKYMDIELICDNQHQKNIKIDINSNFDIYTKLTEISIIKCDICQKSMSIKSKQSIYVESIDID